MPVLAHEGCHERGGRHTCDRRLARSALARAYPAVSYALIEAEEDPLWGDTAGSKCLPRQCPRSAPAPPQGAPDSSGWLGAPTGETGPLGAQPLPRALELVAFDPAAFTAVDRSGVLPDGSYED